MTQRNNCIGIITGCNFLAKSSVGTRPALSGQFHARPGLSQALSPVLSWSYSSSTTHETTTQPSAALIGHTGTPIIAKGYASSRRFGWAFFSFRSPSPAPLEHGDDDHYEYTRSSYGPRQTRRTRGHFLARRSNIHSDAAVVTSSYDNAPQRLSGMEFMFTISLLPLRRAK